MIYISSVLGGPEVEGSRIDRAITKVIRLRGLGQEGAYGSLDVVFHVPGSFVKPDYQGLRTAKFSRKDRKLMVQVSVPGEMVTSEDAESFVVQSLRDAVSLAGPKFDKAGIPYPEQEYLALVEEIAGDLVH